MNLSSRSVLVYCWIWWCLYWTQQLIPCGPKSKFTGLMLFTWTATSAACFICQTFPFSVFSSHWGPLWYFQNLPWLSDSQDVAWLTQLNRKNNQHINMVNCIFSSCCLFFPYILFWLFWFLRSKGRGFRSDIPSYFNLELVYTGVITRWSMLLNQGDMI